MEETFSGLGPGSGGAGTESVRKGWVEQDHQGVHSQAGAQRPCRSRVVGRGGGVSQSLEFFLAGPIELESAEL